MSEAFAQEISETCVFFDREDTCTSLKRQLRQSAQSRPDLHHVIIRGYLSLIDNPSGQILIVQEILPESLDRRNVYLVKRRSYLGELHTGIDTRLTCPMKVVCLFTKYCEQNAFDRGSYSQV